jgi:hypothetical protein
VQNSSIFLFCILTIGSPSLYVKALVFATYSFAATDFSSGPFSVRSLLTPFDSRKVRESLTFWVTQSVCSRKVQVLQAQSTRQEFPPALLMQLRSGLERALRRLCRCRNESKLFQQDRQIVVAVETGDLAIPDLQDMTHSHFARAPRSFKSSCGQIP